MSYIRNVNIAAQDSPSIDAFGRWRVSEPHTIFDSKQIFDNQPLFWDDQEVSGGGTSSSYSQAGALTQIGVSATTAGKRVRQTFMRFNYQPGKSQFVLMTCRLSAAPSGIEANVGPHDDANGLFFSALDGVIYAVIRSSVTGSPVDTAVTQSSWNQDTLDGNGPSGITIDPTKGQIMWWDYEWLGLGRVRCGFVVDGLFIVAHEFLHSNSVTAVYMTTPNLPLRYSIENDGTGPATTLDHICSTVMTEGGVQATGRLRCISTAGTAMTATTENIIYAVIGIRLKAASLGATINVISAAIQIQSASESGEWSLRFNPTVAGTFTYADVTNSNIQSVLGTSSNTVTGGTITQCGFATSDSGGQGRGGTEAQIDNAIRLGANIAGTPDTIVLCWMPNAGTAGHEIEGSITIRELS